MSHHPVDRASESTRADLGAARRSLACARTLLDEIERTLTRAPHDRVTWHGVVGQALEELSRLARLLPPAGDALQDAE